MKNMDRNQDSIQIGISEHSDKPFIHQRKKVCITDKDSCVTLL